MRAREVCAGEKKTIEYLQKEKQESLQDKIVDNTTGDGGGLRSIFGPFTPVDQGSVRRHRHLHLLSKASSLSMTINKRSKRVLYHCEKQWTTALGSIQAKY